LAVNRDGGILVVDYPAIKFRPLFKERIWGGDRLKVLFGKQLPEGEPVGESWELADLAQGRSFVDGGRFDGMDVRELLDEHGVGLGFTAEQAGAPFGLLIKLLDAEDVLSVQVHPDEKACEKIAGAEPKTECWYVLAAEADSVIYRGLKSGVTKEDLVRVIDKGNFAELMEVYPAGKGDFHFLPAGTIHALGAGIVVAEIQTPSDSTFRLYDWGRRDANGNSRELHIEEALESIHFSDSRPLPSQMAGMARPTGLEVIGPAAVARDELKKLACSLGKAENLVDCPYFSVNHVTFAQSGERHFVSPLPFVMLIISGSGTITNVEEPAGGVKYFAGDTILIPNKQEWCIKVDVPGESLLTCL